MTITNNLFVPTWPLDYLLGDSTDWGIPNDCQYANGSFQFWIYSPDAVFVSTIPEWPFFWFLDGVEVLSLSVFHLLSSWLPQVVPISANASTVLLRTYRFWSCNAWIRAFTAPTAPFPILQLPQHHEPIHTDRPAIVVSGQVPHLWHPLL